MQRNKRRRLRFQATQQGTSYTALRASRNTDEVTPFDNLPVSVQDWLKSVKPSFWAWIKAWWGAQV